MNLTLLYASLIVASLDWLAVARRLKPLEYLAKPGVMLLLLAWIWQVGGFRGVLPWFAAGVLFSLVGDIFLMLPKQRFLPGLIAFLLAHLAYIIGLNQPPPAFSLPLLAVALVVLLPAIRIFQSIRAGLVDSGRAAYQLPVALYSLVISLMLLSALLTLTHPDEVWRPGPALLVSAGAMLFYLSDILLAWNRFVNPLPDRRLHVHINYHLGQIGLIAGTMLHTLTA